ncbi:MAG: amino acid-binding domain protein [Clostridiales bacterium]|jgi:chorismate mutase|nr:amino acid-binding domain protein [Clostridiales bacterium]
MSEKVNYYVLKKKAVPEVLLRVVEAKRLMETKKVLTIQEATDTVGISRSSFYKYKDDIFPFYENSRGKNINLSLKIDDEPGILSKVLTHIAVYNANILTIHQSIPVNSIATLSLSIEVLATTGDIDKMIDELQQESGIYYVKILAESTGKA